MANEEDDAFRNIRSGRLLAISVTHVDAKLYRSSRTAADNIRSPAHFDFHVKCTWSGDPSPYPWKSPRPNSPCSPARPSPLSAARASLELENPVAPSFWWDPLPSTYVVKRRWADIERLHDIIEKDLVFDRKAGCRRIKARMPQFPVKANLDDFILGVAATGDARALSRNNPIVPPNERLTDLHTIYVENRLQPYFSQVSRVLDEVPDDVLVESQVFKLFVTDGSSTKHQQSHPAMRPKFFGPQPVALSSEDKTALAIRYRKIKEREKASAEEDGAQQKTKPGGGRLPGNAVAGSISPTSAGMSPSASMIKSASAPSVRDDDIASHDGDDKVASRKLNSSQNRPRFANHYSFFAKNMKGPEFGYSGHRDLWRQMRTKERQELGRRTLLQLGHDAEVARWGDSCERLPRLPPPRPGEFLASVESWAPKHGAQRPIEKSRKTLSLKEMMQHSADMMSRTARADVIGRDICEGLRVAILGKVPAPPTNTSSKWSAPLAEEKYPEPTKRDTMKVYELYRSLLDQEDEGGDDDVSSEEGDEDIEPLNISGGADNLEEAPGKDMMPISWPQFFMWSQRQLDFARDFKYKSVLGALNRSLRLYWQHLAGPNERYLGVSVSLLFRWVWPDAGPRVIAKMLTWMCHYELEKIRQPTPPVIEPQDRRQLESIFKTMDDRGRGYCTADDIAGGKIQDVEAKLKNIVDADTVRAVIREPEIYPIAFLELMCEDNYRAHQDATQVLLDDGRRVELHERDTIGFIGWIYSDADAPQWEEKQRRLIDAVEAEVLRWRRIANAKPLPLWHASADGGGT